VDRQAVWHYLSLGAIPQPRTILADVKMLMPAHVMNYTARSGISIRKYWDVAESGKRRFPEVRGYCKTEAGRHLRKLLEQATKKHLAADVPVGAFLSGGIDSTAVVGLMSQLSRERVRTFSVGFSGEHKLPDELQWARISADRFDTDHTEIVVSGREVAEQFDEIVQSIDQPSLDGTNTFIVSKATSEAVKVAVSGLGGDELFAGYPHFQELSTIAKMEQQFRWLGEPGRKRIFRACPGRFMRNKTLALLNREQRYEALRNLCEDSEKSKRLTKSFVGKCPAKPLAEVYAPWLRMNMDVVSEISYVEMQGYLVNTLLRDADAMSMAHSLEVRPVLLDHEVTEFAFSLPAHLKIDPVEKKPALVNAVRDLLPDSVLNRPKTGFELPLREWLTGPLQDRAVSTYSSTMARSIFSKSFLNETVRNIKQREQVSYRHWAYMILVEWLETHQCEL
jgi:asparagine synthase (glutamine-hydrolysing)